MGWLRDLSDSHFPLYSGDNNTHFKGYVLQLNEINVCDILSTVGVNKT